MTYIEKMTMKIMGEMGYNYGSQPATTKIVQQIIADTKAACIETVEYYFSRYDPLTLDDYKTAITSVKVREQNNG